jgi:hypothetical protein
MRENPVAIITFLGGLMCQARRNHISPTLLFQQDAGIARSRALIAIIFDSSGMAGVEEYDQPISVNKPHGVFERSAPKGGAEEVVGHAVVRHQVVAIV